MRKRLLAIAGVLGLSLAALALGSTASVAGSDCSVKGTSASEMLTGTEDADVICAETWSRPAGPGAPGDFRASEGPSFHGRGPSLCGSAKLIDGRLRSDHLRIVALQRMCRVKQLIGGPPERRRAQEDLPNRRSRLEGARTGIDTLVLLSHELLGSPGLGKAWLTPSYRRPSERT